MNFPSKLLLLIGLFALTQLRTASADVLYSQTFDNTGSGRNFNAHMASLNWTVYTAATGAATAAPEVQAGGRIFSSPPANGGLASALVFLGTSLNIAQSSIATISFDSVQSSAVGRVRILIGIGTQWYASNTVFTPITASSWPSDQSTTTLALNFSTAAADWSLATISAGSAMSISGTALTEDLPVGNITGVGLWDYNTHASNGVTVRLDNVIIASAIPEPTSFAALAGALGLLAAFTARRRRA